MLFYDLTLEIHIIISFTVHSQTSFIVGKDYIMVQASGSRDVRSPLKGWPPHWFTELSQIFKSQMPIFVLVNSH